MARSGSFIVRGLGLGGVLAFVMALPGHARVPEKARPYVVYVASESSDSIARLRFDQGRLTVEKIIATGMMPADADGPHGLAVAPDGSHYYVSMAHGQPDGTLWKYSTDGDKVVGRVTLGRFPATMQVTPDGEFVFVVNFNLHGDRLPSSVSVVATEPMLEVARITTCLMPHGSRLDTAGTHQYSACMMDDTLVEIDTRTFKVSRHLVVTSGRESGGSGPPPAPAPGSTPPEHTADHGGDTKPGDAAPPAPSSSADRSHSACSPTWAQPTPDGRRVFVACNGTSELVEVDREAWKVVRRIPAGQGIYNLATTTNGRLVATNRRGQSVSVFDVVTGRELARVSTQRRVVHGAVVTPDDRYAFISVEGVGAEPGTVEVLDLETFKMIASVDVAPQAGGIDILPGTEVGSRKSEVNVRPTFVTTPT
jgi:DNA-binding beta-propeller fold protein YncE